MSGSAEFIRFGRQLRALRRRRGWRQVDLARAAGVSQSLVSDVERGHLERVALGTLHDLAAGVDARASVGLSWRAGDLDRLTDERHAALAEVVARLLRALGWEVHAEVTFSIDGERGSIDLLAWHATTRSLLVVEIKTELTSVEATLRAHDTKHRLARVVAGRFGWRPATISRLIVLPDGSTARRRVSRLAALVGPSMTTDAWRVRAWLRAPVGTLDGGWVLSDTSRDGAIRTIGSHHRVRTHRKARCERGSTGSGTT
jgi:transcriptional regulator with XRE-family HTH domain